MQLTVSSSLEGRDLALLKSVINILHSDYAGESDWSWNYCDDGSHQIFIAQEFYQNGSEYYAIVKGRENRVIIGTNVNPKNLRSLFEQLASGNLSARINKDFAAISKDQASLLRHIYRYMSSQVQINMCLSGLNDIKIIINKESDHIFSNVPLNQSMVQNTLFKNEIKIRYSECEKTIDFNKMMFKSKASDFLWNLGLMQSDSLLLEDFESEYVSFNQVKWPDFGRLNFHQSFILMSALLSKQPETFKSLKRNHHFKESEIISFINAMSLSAMCIVSTSKENKIIPLVQTPKKPTGFLNKLKQTLFG